MGDNKDFFAVPLDRVASSQSSGGEDLHQDFLIPQTPSKMRSSVPNSPISRISQSPQPRGSIKRARICLDEPQLDGVDVFVLLSGRGSFKPQTRPLYTPEENSVLEDIWKGIKIKDVLSLQNATSINSNSALYEAYEVQASRGIMSAPIIEDHKILGMQDYRSLCSFILQQQINEGAIGSHLSTSSLSSHATVSNSASQSPRESLTSIHSEVSPVQRSTPLNSHKSDSDTDSLATPKLSFAQSPRTSPAHLHHHHLSANSSFSLLSPKRQVSGNPVLIKYATLAALFKQAPAGSIIDSLPAHCKQVKVIKQDDSMTVLLPLFQQGVHRACVVDAEEHFLGVISQSDAIRAVAKHFEQQFFLCSKTLIQLGLDRSSAPITQSQNARVIDALRLLTEANVSSVAQVDSNGALVQNFSTTDIKYVFKQGNQACLYKTCADFMVDVRVVKEGECGYETKMPVFSTTPSSTLQRVISLLIATRTHRIWIVDDLSRPISIVTLTDVLRLLTPSNLLPITDLAHSSNLVQLPRPHMNKM